VEWVESTLPLRYKEVRLNTDSGGPGQWRGGVGTIRTVQLLADSVEINSLGERFLIAPFGLQGGDPGGCNALLIRQGEDSSWRTIKDALQTPSPSKFNGLRSGPDSWFRMMSGGGGGYGSALDRPPSRVLDDVIQGFVSRERALSEYGVVIAVNPDTSLGFDPVKTAEIRENMKTMSRPRQTNRDQAVDRAMTDVTNAAALARGTAVDRIDAEADRRGGHRASPRSRRRQGGGTRRGAQDPFHK
jgi:N-methylhydantoinase B/oxoprolinase/acetone carboxylase alpha subunit